MKIGQKNPMIWSRKDMCKILIQLILVGMSVVATVKVIFFGTHVDEQYAVTMSYRMVANGDRMFLEMWEPHQTSAFLGAILIKIYMMFTGSIEGVVVYLRLVSELFQGIISVFLYNTMKQYCTKETAFFRRYFILIHCQNIVKTLILLIC